MFPDALRCERAGPGVFDARCPLVDGLGFPLRTATGRPWRGPSQPPAGLWGRGVSCDSRRRLLGAGGQDRAQIPPPRPSVTCRLPCLGFVGPRSLLLPCVVCFSLPASPPLRGSVPASLFGPCLCHRVWVAPLPALPVPPPVSLIPFPLGLPTPSLVLVCLAVGRGHLSSTLHISPQCPGLRSWAGSAGACHGLRKRWVVVVRARLLPARPASWGEGLGHPGPRFPPHEVPVSHGLARIR